MAITTSQPACRVPLSSARAMALSLPLLICSSHATAMDWLVAPSLRLRESYTDNALLAPPGKTQSDFITEIAPSLALIGNGPRLQVHLDATWRTFRYQHQSGNNSDSQQLQAQAKAELIKQWFYLDTQAGISQRSISPFGPQVISDVPPPHNSSQVRTLSLSPYLRHTVRMLGTAELRYTRNTVSSGALLSSHSDEVTMLFNSVPHGAGWTWNASYDARRTQENTLDQQRMERASLGLRYPFNSRWAATASTGQEQEGYVSSTGKAPQGRFWALGGVWTPSVRTSVAFSKGQRFFGNTYSLDAAFRQRHTSWSVVYSEDITTMPAQFLRLGNSDAASMLDQLWAGIVPDARQRQLRINAFLQYANSLGPELGAINYFSHQYFLQKQLKLSMARATAKGTLLFGVNAVDRTAQTNSSIDSGLLPDVDLGSEERTRQIGSNLGWTWQASSRTSVSANAGYATVRSLSVPRRDNNLTVTAGVSRTLQAKMTASIDVRHTRHSSTQGGAYRESGVSATLNMQF